MESQFLHGFTRHGHRETQCGIGAKVKNPWTRGFKVNRAIASTWAIETVAPISWTTTRFEINAQNLEFTVFINVWTTMGPFTTKHHPHLATRCFSFSDGRHGRNPSTTLDACGISAMSKKNTSVSPWVRSPSHLDSWPWGAFQGFQPTVFHLGS